MNYRRKQEGAVLIVSLLILLLVTLIGFATMETSKLESKMATARELKEISFQTAEAIIEEATADMGYLGRAYSAYLVDPNDPTWPTDPNHIYTGYDSGDRVLNAGGDSTMRFITTASTIGYSIRKGSAGLETYYYEAQGVSSLSNSNISNTHAQGVFVEAPRVD